MYGDITFEGIAINNVTVVGSISNPFIGVGVCSLDTVSVIIGVDGGITRGALSMLYIAGEWTFCLRDTPLPSSFVVGGSHPQDSQEAPMIGKVLVCVEKLCYTKMTLFQFF